LSFTAVAYRACGHETPLWAFPNGGEGRYNRAGTIATQYLSLHPMTPWAELMRIMDARAAGAARALRLEIWGIRIVLADAPEEISFDTAGSFGVAAADLVSDDHGPCRSLAAALHAGEVHSFSAPSAALPGTTNLIVLDPAVVIDYHAEPLDPEDWPTALLAQNGRCPEALWHHVHYTSAPAEHPALTAWRAGHEYVFTQPEVTRATLAAA
jgi:RES domain-containing protein